jgi:site-specific recombinase XerD
MSVKLRPFKGDRVECGAAVDVGGCVHIFPHSFWSHLAIKGVPARAVQEFAGNADLTTTMRVRGGDLRELDDRHRPLRRLYRNSAATTLLWRLQ